MPGAPIRIGPFIGGLNTLSDPSSLADQELVSCINYELDLDGSLVSRPPVTDEGNGPGTTALFVLGYGVFASNTYMFLSASDGTYHYVDGVYTKITSVVSSAMVQYADKVWLISSTTNGGYWEPGGSYTPVATMPKGESAIMLKGRMYIASGRGSTTNRSRAYYCAPTDPTTWDPSGFLDVNPGDGQALVDLIVFNDNLVLFKEDSTYVLAFDISPANATLRLISATIGATRRRCVVLHEQTMYVYHEGNVYEVINYDFSRLNSKVVFAYDPGAFGALTDEVFICLFGDRLLVRYYSKVYVFGLRTRTWTQWDSLLPFGPLLPAPSNVTQAVNDKYFAGSASTNNHKLYRIDDGFDIARSEDMICYIKTKNYDVAVSHKFKRLFWWGVDVNTVTPVTGAVTPVIFSFVPTWGLLAQYTWGQLATWGSPLNSATVTTEGVVTNSGGIRRFIKFLKGIRFRQVYFEVTLTNNGTTSQAPVRLFNLTALIDTKEDVVAAVS